VVPLGLAHKAVHDDVYRDMRIPANTTILANVWGILHDEMAYPNPMKFDPERFVGSSPPGVNEYPIESFGFGRRICPGRYLADSSVWMIAACVLATFTISKAVDEHGAVVEPDPEFSSTLLSRPKPFQCKITPRSDAAVTLIRDTSDDQS